MTTITPSENVHQGSSDDALRHERIMASAGSGKTFQLTNRYLRLILENAEPASILASTFTRLAAGEIRDRILERLADAATDDSQRSELAQHTAVGELSRQKVLEHLVTLTRSLHQLQVRTLDSFFAGIVRCFALELGLDPAASIVDDETDQQLRREAITRMLDEADPQPIIDLLRLLTEGSTERSVTASIDAYVKELYELYRDAPPEAWHVLEPVPTLSQAKVAAAIDALAQCDLGTTNGHLVKAHKSACDAIRGKRHDDYNAWLAFLSKGIPAKLLQGEYTFHRVDLCDQLIQRYQPLIDHARAVIHNSVVNRTHAMHQLLERFEYAFEHVKAANKALTFSDITWKMAQAQQLGTLDEICFRIDATLRHILLDEMQDTSIAQWRALYPLVTEILAYRPPERSFFCVGDVKQSIYGWREACPEILESLCSIATDQQGNSMIAGDRQLAKSWRSSPVIMQTVNHILTDVASNHAMAEFKQAARSWDDAFVQHETARTTLPGYAEMRVASQAEEGQDQRRLRLHEAAQLIKQLHQQCPGASIGVLARRNRIVNTLLYELGPSQLNVPASGRGGGALTDSAAVNVILDLLRLADHPRHSIAAFNVIHSPLGELVGLRTMHDCDRVARRVRQQVLEQGFAPTIQEWMRAIGSRTDRRQFRRLVQLQQLAVEFDKNPTLRCDDFLQMVQMREADDPTAAPVQVMTVHHSKGLEFDIVVLPELEGTIVSRDSPTMLYDRDGSAGPIQCVARHLNKDVTEMIPELADMYEAHRQRCARESMCLLYVALTRARHALHMIIDPPKHNERTLPKTLEGLLRSALIPSKEIEPNTTMWQLGDPNWHQHIDRMARPSEDAQSTQADDGDRMISISLATPTDRIPRGRAAVAASHDDLETLSIAAQLRLPNTQARERGTVIHAMFERITWLEDGQPDHNTLLKLARDIAPRKSEAWARQQVDAFLHMLEQPQIKAALSRNNTPPQSLALYREFPFARMVDGAVQQGFIDRLVAHMEEGQVISAHVIDFKTDDISLDDLPDRVALYQKQLETYRSAAASALDISEDQIQMTLLFTTLGTAVPL